MLKPDANNKQNPLSAVGYLLSFLGRVCEGCDPRVPSDVGMQNRSKKITKNDENTGSTTTKLHQPGIEPGSVPWQGTILPLDHWCLMFNFTKHDLYTKEFSVLLS